jgi:hypothetical protein
MRNVQHFSIFSKIIHINFRVQEVVTRKEYAYYSRSYWFGGNERFRRVRKFRISTISFIMSVRPHAATRLTLESLIFGYFWKICRENSSFIKIWQAWRVLSINTYVHIWYLAQFFLEWEMFQTQVVKNIKTHILCSIFFFRNSCRLWENAEKYCTARWATCHNISRFVLFSYWIPKATNIQSEYTIRISFSRQHC